MIQLLDRVTGRVTMYRLVTLSLTVIAVAAIGLGAIGQVAFSPAELLASLAAALTGTIGSNAVVGLVLRRRAHTESSIITGLLLFFLFFPSTDGADLGSIVLAGVFATLSKYLLAWRGRHVLNPAAAGAALIAVVQLNSAVWWVATGALLPLVLVGAVLVLHRTRHLAIGLVFVAVAATILTLRLTLGGQGVADAAATVFTSYPVIFFAGFMLSEPLTLPPRRWQKLALAAIVGVLFTLTYTFPPVYLSFEAALLIGNALAFLAGQRRAIRLSYLGKRQLTPTAWEFLFQPTRTVRFLPGQYVEVTLPHSRQDPRGSRRVFSIASAPALTPELVSATSARAAEGAASGTTSDGGASPTAASRDIPPLRLAMRLPRDDTRTSTFKRHLLQLPEGTAVEATAVGGDFVLPRDPAVPVLLIAGGIGITPFLSQLAHDRGTGVTRDSVLVYSVGSLAELAFVDELVDERVLLLCPEHPSTLPEAWTWAGPGPLSADLLRASVPDASRRRAFVSGSPATVNTGSRTLRELGVRRVTTDYFSGY